MTGRPPTLADRLLLWAVPPGDRGATMRGDLLEEFRERARARRPARVRVVLAAGGVDCDSIRRTTETARARSRHMRIERLWQDLKYAVRSYARTPTFTDRRADDAGARHRCVDGDLLDGQRHPAAAAAAATDPDRLVYATEVNAKGGTMSLSWLNYLDWRERTQSFDVLAASREEPQTLTGVERAQRLRARRVTGNFFQVLGVAPAIGRGFTDADDRPNAEPVGRSCRTSSGGPSSPPIPRRSVAR